MEDWVCCGGTRSVGGRPFHAALILSGTVDDVIIEDSTCTSITLRAGVQDVPSGQRGASTVFVQGESGPLAA